jgi:hypothetical protein
MRATASPLVHQGLQAHRIKPLMMYAVRAGKILALHIGYKRLISNSKTRENAAVRAGNTRWYTLVEAQAPASLCDAIWHRARGSDKRRAATPS